MTDAQLERLSGPSGITPLEHFDRLTDLLNPEREFKGLLHAVGSAIDLLTGEVYQVALHLNRLDHSTGYAEFNHVRPNYGLVTVATLNALRNRDTDERSAHFNIFGPGDGTPPEETLATVTSLLVTRENPIDT